MEIRLKVKQADVVKHGASWGLPTLVLQLVQVHELAGFGVEAQGCLPLRLPPLLLLLLAGSPGHLLLQLVQLAALCYKEEEKRSEALPQQGALRWCSDHRPTLAPQPGHGSSCRMAPLLFDLGTERQEGPDISARFCCPTSL